MDHFDMFLTPEEVYGEAMDRCYECGGVKIKGVCECQDVLVLSFIEEDE